MRAVLAVDERRLLDQQADAVGDPERRFLAGAFDDQREFLAAGAGDEHVLRGCSSGKCRRCF